MWKPASLCEPHHQLDLCQSVNRREQVPSPQAFARGLGAGVLTMLSAVVPSATLYPALAAMEQDGAVRASEEMQQVLSALKTWHGGLLQEAGLFVQHLKEIACLWGEQWMHILRDVQVILLHGVSHNRSRMRLAARRSCLP